MAHSLKGSISGQQQPDVELILQLLPTALKIRRLGSSMCQDAIAMSRLVHAPLKAGLDHIPSAPAERGNSGGVPAALQGGLKL